MASNTEWVCGRATTVIFTRASGSLASLMATECTSGVTGTLTKASLRIVSSMGRVRRTLRTETPIKASMWMASRKATASTNGRIRTNTRGNSRTDWDMARASGSEPPTETTTRASTPTTRNADLGCTFGTVATSTQACTSTTSGTASAKCSGSTAPTIEECGKKAYSTAKARCISLGEGWNEEFSIIISWLENLAKMIKKTQQSSASFRKRSKGKKWAKMDSCLQ